MLQNKKLLFFDADGTIVSKDSQGAPSAEMCEALKLLRASGHKTFLCTGRTLCDIGEELLNAGFDGIIAGAGAYISIHGQCVYHQTITQSLLKETIKQIIKCQVSCLLEGTYGFFYVGEGTQKMPWDFPRIASEEDLKGNESIEKFTAHIGKAQELDELRQFLIQHYEIYTISNGRFYEMAIKDINKASALKRVCEYYKEKPENTVAFGDSQNDLSIINIAGFGVAMGNAPRELQEVADFVTGTVEENGVPKALHYLKMI